MANEMDILQRQKQQLTTLRELFPTREISETADGGALIHLINEKEIKAFESYLKDDAPAYLEENQTETRKILGISFGKRKPNFDALQQVRRDETGLFVPGSVTGEKWFSTLLKDEKIKALIPADVVQEFEPEPSFSKPLHKMSEQEIRAEIRLRHGDLLFEDMDATSLLKRVFPEAEFSETVQHRNGEKQESIEINFRDSPHLAPAIANFFNNFFGNLFQETPRNTECELIGDVVRLPKELLQDPVTGDVLHNMDTLFGLNLAKYFADHPFQAVAELKKGNMFTPELPPLNQEQAEFLHQLIDQMEKQSGHPKSAEFAHFAKEHLKAQQSDVIQDFSKTLSNVPEHKDRPGTLQGMMLVANMGSLQVDAMKQLGEPIVGWDRYWNKIGELMTEQLQREAKGQNNNRSLG
jgi:hypothetical protein